MQSLIEQLTPDAAIKSVTAQMALGKAEREHTPIDSLGLRPVLERDPVAFISAIEANLIPELLPQRHARMVQNPAAFFRGTAELMAHDLSHEAHTNIKLLGDGDAHLQNFGFYASPERQLLFDLNDFDEAAINPFEYDIKRLATSAYLLGAQQHYAEDAMDDLVRHLVRTYRKSMHHACKQTVLERFYASTEVHDLMAGLDDTDAGDLIQRVVNKAAKRDHQSVVKKYTTTNGRGQLRFIDRAPRSVHVEADTEVGLMQGLAAYRQTTRADVNLLLRQYHLTDLIRHSVGIGSFGTHCYLALLTGPGGSPLVLQIKEALPRRRELSAGQELDLDLEVSAGQRIIAAQQILQKASDPFLGWFTLGKRSYYVRQFRDMKESLDISGLSVEQFGVYADVCAYLLAMAHVQSPTAAAAVGYMNKQFDAVIAKWCKGYLHQVIDDYAAFVAAVAPSGGDAII